jgi:Spy/CpxP family protein refolding chaperone
LAFTERERTHLFAAVLLIATFVTGLLAGIALDRWALRGPRDFRHGPRFERMGGHTDEPRPFSRRATERLMRELELSAAQRSAVDSLLERHLERTREIQRTTRPRLDSITKETHNELMEILTPAQRQRFEELHERRGRGGRARH